VERGREVGEREQRMRVGGVRLVGGDDGSGGSAIGAGMGRNSPLPALPSLVTQGQGQGHGGEDGWEQQQQDWSPVERREKVGTPVWERQGVLGGSGDRDAGWPFVSPVQSNATNGNRGRAGSD